MEKQEYYSFLDKVCAHSLGVMSAAIEGDKIILNGIDPSNEAHLALLNIGYMLRAVSTKTLTIYVKTSLWKTLKLKWKFAHIHYLHGETKVPTLDQLIEEIRHSLERDIEKKTDIVNWLKMVYREYYTK